MSNPSNVYPLKPPSSPLKAFKEAINQPCYGTVYAFNRILSPMYVKALEERFRHVEQCTRSTEQRDSHRSTYNLHHLTIYTGHKDNLDKPLMVAFMEAVDRDMEGKADFLSWKIKPQVDCVDDTIDGKVFKVYTLKAAFTVR